MGSASSNEGDIVSTNELVLEDLMNIYEEISLEHDEDVKTWRFTC